MGRKSMISYLFKESNPNSSEDKTNESNNESYPISNSPTLYGNTKIIPQIRNIVCTASVGCKLDLDHIFEKGANVKRFSNRVVMTIKDPKSTATIFGSGKIVCAGTKGEEQALMATRKFTDMIEKLGYKTNFSKFKIHNSVANFDLSYGINLVDFFKKHERFSTYNPEVFSALSYRMQKPKITFSIFSNGKVIMTGAKSKDEITEACEIMYPIFHAFKH